MFHSGSGVLTHLSIQQTETWYVSGKDAIRYPQQREDNGEAVTLFPPHCRDEILQTDAPISPKPSDETLILTEGSLISSPSGKHSRCPKIHLSVTKWTLIFSIWRKALNRSAINSRSETCGKFWKLLQMLFSASTLVSFGHEFPFHFSLYY